MKLMTQAQETRAVKLLIRLALGVGEQDTNLLNALKLCQELGVIPNTNLLKALKLCQELGVIPKAEPSGSVLQAPSYPSEPPARDPLLGFHPKRRRKRVA